MGSISKRWRRWVIAGMGLIVLTALQAVFFSDTVFFGLVVTATAIWMTTTLLIVGYRVWRWLTYRISVRLLLSYLLIGVAPILLVTALGVFCAYVAIGQYTSVRFGSSLQSTVSQLQREVEAALEVAVRGDAEEALAFVRAAEARPPSDLPRVVWLARFGADDYRSPGAEGIPLPQWDGRLHQGQVVRAANMDFLIVGAADEAKRFVFTAMVPLDAETARSLNASSWHDVYFYSAQDEGGADEEYGDGAEYGVTVSSGDGEGGVRYNHRRVPVEEVWEEWPEGESLLDRPLVFWVRVVPEVRDLVSGDVIEGFELVTLLKTSPSNAWDDFVLSRYELAEALRIAFYSVSGFFLAVYLGAVLIAGVMISSIARSTSRLTRGAKEVGQGNLDYRIKVKRKDQLGDLAISFNHMTESVQSMLVEVAEKERLARELDLAREIQESLLPEKHLNFGAIEVNATFRPAAEVGGDYFDVFTTEEQGLTLTIGDVAGHGLPTGLLMAMLKSSVASLIREGYRGVELVRRVNEVLRTQGQHRMLATLMLVELDLEENSVAVTNAGHPPGFLLSSDGELTELASGAFPLGGGLGTPATGSYSFQPGSKLILYSDGLVEAQGHGGEPYGYERLAELLKLHADSEGIDLQARIMKVFDEYTEGRALADDLSLLVVQRGL
jgi:sigma-B regulation protein RsbU (phosphoserine phosphatase)